MVTFPVHVTDLRLTLPIVVWLEAKDFDRAKNMSSQATHEAQQWQTYLNVLAQFGVEQWLSENLPNQTVYRDFQVTESISAQASTGIANLKVGEFQLGLIATENLLDEVLEVPRVAIEPDSASHFYVALEVLEEETQIIIRGILRYDQLIDYLKQNQSQLLQNDCYRIPLALFDPEPNHLLFYCQFLDPAAIPLAQESTTTATETPLVSLSKTANKLSQWLQGLFGEGWQTIESLISPESQLALSTRCTDLNAKRGKLIDMGVQLGNQTVALLITISSEAEGKLGILVQIHPTGGDCYLPSNLKLTLLSKAGKVLQEIHSRGQDNYIQLKRFKGEPGKRFSIEVSLGDQHVRENFEF